MRPLAEGLAFLAHAQLVMAFSAVCYVQTAAFVIAEGGASPAWLLAAGFGTWGLYLLDSVRSAEREDGISQPRRAMFFRRGRSWAIALGILCVFFAVINTVLAQPSFAGWCILVILGVLGVAYLFPVVPARARMVTLKDHARTKPFAISVAWLAGALLIALETRSTDVGLPWDIVLGFVLASGPLLLLDSFWLDRRDMSADAAFQRVTIAGALSPHQFSMLLVSLLVISFLGIPFVGVAIVFSFVLGAGWLLLIDPNRLAFEGSRVWLAALWRFTGFLGVLALSS